MQHTDGAFWAWHLRMTSMCTAHTGRTPYAPTWFFLDTANYVRLQGEELPIRWSAIEVLKENKYTKASDVWSFGVLIFEVMSRGAQPYSEFATLNEVAAQIKRGYVNVFYVLACLIVCFRLQLI